MEKYFYFYKNELETEYRDNIEYEKILPTFSHININAHNLIPLSTIYFLFSHNKFKLRRLMNYFYLYRKKFTLLDDMEEKKIFTYYDYKFTDIISYENIKKNNLNIYEFFPGDFVCIENNTVVNLYRENIQLVCIVAKIENNNIFIKPIRYDMEPFAVQFPNMDNLKLYDLIFIRLNDIFYRQENNFYCTFITHLGNCNNIDQYDRAILYNNGILESDRITETDINAYVEPFFNTDSHIYRENNMATRTRDFVDLTNILTLSIDPVTTTDIDDAFSIEIIRADGNYLQFQKHVLNFEKNRKKFNFLLDKINISDQSIDFNNIARFYKIGIHIADLSRFLSYKCINSLNLGNTFYFENFKLEMIAKEISGDLASLVPGVDRFAISLILSVVFYDDQVLITDVEICRSMIRCDLKLSYECAEEIFNKTFKCRKCEIPSNINWEYKTDWCFKCVDKNSPYCLDDLREQFHIINKFSSHLSMIRKSTYREFNKEIKLFDSHLIIENMMIAANMCVTMIIYSKYEGDTLIRYHERNLYKERKFLNALSKHYNLGKINTIGELYSAIEHLDINVVTGIRKAIILNIMNLAKYGQFKDISGNNTSVLEVSNSLSDIFEKEGYNIIEKDRLYLHYGLGVDFYCHFTSPIRRYFDFLIHQQLISILEEREMEFYFDINLTLNHLNNMKTKQRQAGLMSTKHITYCREKNKNEKYLAFILTETTVYIPNLDLIGYVEHTEPIYNLLNISLVDDDYAFYIENKVPVKILKN